MSGNIGQDLFISFAGFFAGLGQVFCKQLVEGVGFSSAPVLRSPQGESQSRPNSQLIGTGLGAGVERCGLSLLFGLNSGIVM